MAKLLTVKELEKTLQMSRSTIYRLRKKHGMPYYEISNQVRFDLDEVKKWLNEHQKQNA